MKKDPYDWEKEVQATMDLAESIPSAQASPLLKERILARLETDAVDTAPIRTNWVRNNRFAIAAAVLLLAANTFTVLKFSGSSSSPQEVEGVEAIAETYQMTLGSDY